MAKRDRAFRKFKRNRDDDNWNSYKKLRNICNKLVRNAKRRHISEQIASCSAAGLWKFLRSLGLCKSKAAISEFNMDLNVLNNHFAASVKLSTLIKSNTLNEIQLLPMPTCDPFEFSHVSQDRLLKIINSIKTKAVGCDDIGRIMIAHLTKHILPSIAHIVNFSLTSGYFPDLWRKAYVLPLPKVPNPVLPNQFRPISILPFLSKLIESVVHRQLTDYLSNANLFNQFQSGFRSAHSTTTALLKVTEDIRSNMDNQLVTLLVLVDFSNAFNAVDHDLLLSLFPRLNFSPAVVKWFSSYLQDRCQAIRTGSSFSDWASVETGVPQGGILSPLLFSLFINLLAPHIKSHYHMYADDLQLYYAAPVDDLDNAISYINADLSRLHAWAVNYGISVNPNKCQAIIIGSSRQLNKVDQSSLPFLSYNGCIIPFSSSVKNLGVYFDCKLSWSEQVKDVCRKFYTSFHSLIRLKNFLPTSTKISLVNALLLPIIDYADVCTVDLNSEYLNKLDRLLNTCIRFIFGLRKFDHISAFRKKLNWLPIRERRNLRILCMLFSILNDPNTPSYLKNMFHYLTDTHERNLRSDTNLLLATPKMTTSFLSNSFSNVAVQLWNELPNDVKKVTSRERFKRLVREFYHKKLS